MSEMVERVASAMFCAEYGYDADRWDDADEEGEKFEYRRLARAAISAMREPTIAMCAAGDEKHRGVDDPDDTPELWRAMIDAAFADETMTAPTEPKDAPPS